MISRKSVNECIVAGHTIPPNTLLFVNIWSIGRNPKYWENPLEFRPKRFLEPIKTGDDDPITRNFIDVKGQHFEFLPFGSGRRGCPGMVLAMQELLAVVAVMMQCFDFETTKSVDMAERPGLTSPRATDLICRLKLRMDHPLKMLHNPQD
ncbi:hypothetical protein ACH5RR_010010 [Cinchona calisaya]|uniref:Cytochrome P450 n=1 Tax=Cinchona calisaya TaxID=153742 RepID=A0ABD3AIJ4_9GENT